MLGRGSAWASAHGTAQRVERPRVVEPLHVPAVAAVALGHVLGERERGVALDRDVVVVVEARQAAEAGARRSTTPRRRRPPAGRRRSRCSTCGGRRSRGRGGCSGPPASARRAPSRPSCRHPGRAGRWSSRCPACRAAPGGPASPTPTAGTASGRRSTPRSRPGAAPSTGGCRRGRTRARTGRGSASADRPGRAASAPRRGGRRPARVPSACRMSRVRLLDGVHGERADGRDRALFDRGHEAGSPVRLVVVLVEPRRVVRGLGASGHPFGEWSVAKVVPIDLDRRVGTPNCVCSTSSSRCSSACWSTPGAAITCTETASKPLVIVHAWTSCTSRTPSTAHSARPIACGSR